MSFVLWITKSVAVYTKLVKEEEASEQFWNLWKLKVEKNKNMLLCNVAYYLASWKPCQSNMYQCQKCKKNLNIQNKPYVVNSTGLKWVSLLTAHHICNVFVHFGIKRVLCYMAKFDFIEVSGFKKLRFCNRK